MSWCWLTDHDWVLEKENAEGIVTAGITGYKIGEWKGKIYRCRKCLKIKKVIIQEDRDY